MQWRWMASLPALLLLSQFATAAPDQYLPTTTFFGSVLDSATGAPIFNATVYIRNYTAETFFFGRTDAQGLYSIQIGKGGTYQIDVMHDAYEYVSTSSNISTWEAKHLDHLMRHYEDNCNIRVMKNGGPHPFHDAIVELEEEMPNGSFYSIRSDIWGWANITIPPGNYTLRAYAPHYRPHIGSIHIGADDYRFNFVTIGPEMADMDAPTILFDEPYKIPSRSALVIGISAEEEYSLYLQFRSDGRVSSYTVPGDHLESFLNWTKGFPVDNGSTPLYDSALLEGRNGGMTSTTWTTPYHIVIVNDGSEPANVQVTLRYEWGSFDVSEPDIVPLDKEQNGLMDRIIDRMDSIVGLYILMVIGIIVIMVYLGSRKDRKEVDAEEDHPIRRPGRPIGDRPHDRPKRPRRH